MSERHSAESDSPYYREPVGPDWIARQRGVSAAPALWACYLCGVVSPHVHVLGVPEAEDPACRP